MKHIQNQIVKDGDYNSAIKLIEEKLQDNPDSQAELYDLLFLYKKANRFQDYEKVLLKTYALYPLSEEIWESYIEYKFKNLLDNNNSLLTQREKFDEKYKMIQLFKFPMEDFAYNKIIIKFLSLLISLRKEIKILIENSNLIDTEINKTYPEITTENILKYFSLYLPKCGLDINKSFEIYDLYYNFKLYYCSNNDDILYNIWLERIKIPHKDIEKTWLIYEKWEYNNDNRKQKTKKIYNESLNKLSILLSFDNQFHSILLNHPTLIEDNLAIALKQFIIDNAEKLIKINPNLIEYYYECCVEKYINDPILWKEYIDYTKYKDIKFKIDLLRRASRSCRYIDFTFSYLREMELQSYPVIQIEKSINKIFQYIHNRSSLTEIEINFTFEIWKYYLEFKCRNYDTKQDIIIRNLFHQCITEMIKYNQSTNLSVIYHIWAEYEAYISKNVEQLHKVMKSVCYDNNTFHSYRAYLYYIKGIGTSNDVRQVYKKAFDNCKVEREILKQNWLSWEKIFGDINSITNTSHYIDQVLNADNQYQNEDKIIQQIPNEKDNNNIQKIIIKNIPSEMNEKELEKFIIGKCPLVSIKDVRIVRDSNGESRNFSFVEFHHFDDAQTVVSEINNSIIESNEIFCALSKPSKEGENDNRTIFINNLSFDTTKEDIQNVFNNYGKIYDIRIIYNNQTKKPRGYCYIEFQEEESVERIIEDVNPIIIKGRTLKIERSQSIIKLRKQLKFIAFIKNFNFKLKEEKLMKFIVEMIGIQKENIVKILICKDDNGKSKGYGFVEVKTQIDLDKLLGKSGIKLMGRSLLITESKSNITDRKNNDSQSNDNDIIEMSKKKRKRSESKEDGNNVQIKGRMTNKDFKELFKSNK